MSGSERKKEREGDAPKRSVVSENTKEGKGGEKRCLHRFWGKRTTKGKAELGGKSGTATRRSDMEEETIRKGQNPPTVPDELRKMSSSADATRNTTTEVGL